MDEICNEIKIIVKYSRLRCIVFIHKFAHFKTKCLCVNFHHQNLSRRARMSTAALTQSSNNIFFVVSFPASMADFHSLITNEFFQWSACYAFKSRFSTTGKRNFGRLIGRGASGGSLYRTCFGRRLFSIRDTWPAHRRRRCLMMVMRS